MAAGPQQHSLTVNWYRSGGDVACISLAGEIGMCAGEQLAALARQLTSFRTVYLDTATVSFADSVFVHFLVAGFHAVPARARLLVCRPGAMTAKLIEATSVDLIIGLRPDLPPDWHTASSRAKEPA
jgi:anti-anti-sigma regulatory factor